MSSRNLNAYNDFAVFDLHDVLALAEHALTADDTADQALVLQPGQPMTLTSAIPAVTALAPVPGYSPDHDRRLDLPAPLRLPLTNPTDPLASLLAKLYQGLAAGDDWLLLRHPWDDTDTSLETGTAHSLPAHLQPAEARRIPATVSIDELGPFPATVVKGFTWNGWALPDFDLDAVRDIAAHINATNADTDSPTTITIDDDSGHVSIIEYVGTPDEDRTVYDGDGGRYPIGSWYWCWSIDTTPGLPHLPPPDARLWFPYRDAKALAAHARAGFGHLPVHYPAGGSSTGPGLILSLAPGGAQLRSNRPGSPQDPAPAPVTERRLHSHDHAPTATAEVLLPLDRFSHWTPSGMDRCAAWLTVNVWLALPGLGAPLTQTYRTFSTREIDTTAYTWRPAQLACTQFPGRVYPGEIAEGVTTATGVLARFDLETVAQMASDTARVPGAVWVDCCGDSVQLKTSQSLTPPDDILQMGWAQRDPDGRYLLGVHQLDWQPAAPPAA